MPARKDIKKVLVIGSGPIVIGQAAEFDYSGSQACRALKEEGYTTVLVNHNPATIQTDPDIANVVYLEPVEPEIVADIIRKEKPDGILPTMGGQTGLNIAEKLHKMGVLEKENVEMLGTPIDTIEKAEDREEFKQLLREIDEPMPESETVETVEDAIKIAEKIGYPAIVRPAYTLGGTGGGVAYNQDELRNIAKRGLQASLIGQVLIEESVLGWHEIEWEVMRDANDNCNVVCSMENFDPMGVHTGDSIVVAPIQTLNDEEIQKSRSVAIKIIRALGVEGGCNIQLAVNPENKFDYRVIEVNPRVSRSSALASKATGYPIARISAKVALGLTLEEIDNDVTKGTKAFFEPALDYIVSKIPRWPFDKFKSADKIIGTQMKATGEVMAIGRTFEESIQKAIRSLDIGRFGFGSDGKDKVLEPKEKLEFYLRNPTHKRIFAIHEALRQGYSIDRIHDLTKIDKWFLNKLKNIYFLECELKKLNLNSKNVDKKIIQAKKTGFSDVQLAYLFEVDEHKIREIRKKLVKPTYKMVDTCAAEFEAKTPYYYSTYEDISEVRKSDKKKVLIIGGGPIRIGQGIEFDYCTVHAVFALKERGIESIILNNNPETVSTDYDTADKLYFEPITYEDVMNVVDAEKPDGIMVQFGGQAPINLATRLKNAGVKILGTDPESIDIAENRKKFTEILNKLKIPQADFGTGFTVEEAKKIADRIGYPVLVRPSYVLGGRAMEIVQSEKDLIRYMKSAAKISPDHPVLIDKFLQDTIEIDVDAICDGENVFIGGVMEHIEQAGVHSGDSACVLPPQKLSSKILSVLMDYTEKLALDLNTIGLINIQYAVRGNSIYILEANPRASRTIPFVSKSIGIPLAKIATKVMLGEKLKDIGLIHYIEPKHVAIKEVMFPFLKLPGVDPILSPEMKSTGESMGIDNNMGMAFYKASLGAGTKLPMEGTIFISVKEDDKPKIYLYVKKLIDLGFDIIATKGTYFYLKKKGLKLKKVYKIREGRPSILDKVINNEIDFIVNTPSKGRFPQRDGFKIRRAAVEINIPYVTTLEALEAAIEAIGQLKKGKINIESINEYHAKIK